jgi:hypothetical protein
MTEEGAPCTASLGFSTDGFGDAPVESLDKTVGLRPLRPDAVMGLCLSLDSIGQETMVRPRYRHVTTLVSRALIEFRRTSRLWRQ